MKEEWGPWIEHDGKGCPVANGVITNCIWDHGFERIAAVTANGRRDEINPWLWIDGQPNIIRYRVRKPRGMVVLESILADLPAPMPWDVTA